MRLNTVPRIPPVRTHEGGRADAHQKPLQELERAVSTCLLWENTFYEKGSEVAARIKDLCTKVSLDELADLALRTRTDLKLRHVPLFLAVQMARVNSQQKAKNPIVSLTINAVIQRADELAEFLSLYWQEKRQPLSKQVKLGLQMAFPKFSRFQLAKWNRDNTIKLQDVLFLAHPKPTSDQQAQDWKDLAGGTLEAPDTWEVALSSGADKRVTWERLLVERKLGYMALLMNLRNMTEAKVDPNLVRGALIAGAPNSRALPFRFLSAAKAAPNFADALSQAMTLAVTDRLPGNTVILVDVSGSMDVPISAKSHLNRWEAAGALAVLLREMTPECRVFTFSNTLVEVMNVKGIPLVMAIGTSQQHSSTQLGAALAKLQQLVSSPTRIVVVTDEQSHDGVTRPWGQYNYLINVAPYKPSLELSGGWSRINGWSEAIVRWMALEEGSKLGEGEEN